MKDLLSELVQARYRAAGRAMDEAEKHIIEAMDLLDDAIGGWSGPKPSARAVRQYLDEAYYAAKDDDSSSAVAALGSAIEMLEPNARGGVKRNG
jgi:hypothetical protein